MKIIAGKHRSRILKTLSGSETRPMTSRMKETVFNIIGPFLNGENVLDLFGGSGALALEALSRGAGYAWITDKSRKACRIIGDNAAALGETERIRIINDDYRRALSFFKKEKTAFDLIFLDPPYRMNIIDELLATIKDACLLRDGGIVVCHYGRRKRQSEAKGYLLLKKDNYGSGEFCIYEKEVF